MGDTAKELVSPALVSVLRGYSGWYPPEPDTTEKELESRRGEATEEAPSLTDRGGVPAEASNSDQCVEFTRHSERGTAGRRDISLSLWRNSTRKDVSVSTPPESGTEDKYQSGTPGSHAMPILFVSSTNWEV